jgi:hypothetical protein
MPPLQHLEDYLELVAADPWYWDDRRHLEAYRGTYS